MAGEIEHVTAAEIAQYGEAMNNLGAAEAHFYDDTANVSPAVLAAIKAL